MATLAHLGLPAVQRPVDAMPLEELTQPRLWQMLERLGLLTADGDALSAEAAELLRLYTDTFVISHSGTYARKPDQDTVRMLCDLRDAGVAIDRHFVAYRPRENGLRCTQPWKRYDSALHRAAKHHGVDIRDLDQEVKRDLDERHPRHLDWTNLAAHFLGGDGNPLLLRFLQLETRKKSQTTWLCLDIDDHGKGEQEPGSPSTAIRQRLLMLHGSRWLHPRHAIMVSSPSGVGRHLYYRLRHPIPITTLIPAVESHLCALALASADLEHVRIKEHVDLPGKSPHRPGYKAEVVGVDVFPRNHQRAATQTLPFCRRSIPCDLFGRPMRMLSLLDRLRWLSARIAASDTRVDAHAFVASMRQLERQSEHLWKRKLVPPLSEVAPPVLPAGDHDGETTNEAIWQMDLAGQGQRVDACKERLRWCRGAGMTQDAAVARVQDWLREHHAGKSKDYNANPDHALRHILYLARGIYGAVSFRVDDLRLQATDVAALIARMQRSPQFTLLIKPGATATHLLSYACHFIAAARHFGAMTLINTSVPGARRPVQGMLVRLDYRIRRQLPFSTDQRPVVWHKMLKRLHVLHCIRPAERGEMAVLALMMRPSAPLPSDLPVNVAMADALELLGRSTWERFFTERTWYRHKDKALEERDKHARRIAAHAAAP